MPAGAAAGDGGGERCADSAGDGGAEPVSAIIIPCHLESTPSPVEVVMVSVERSKLFGAMTALSGSLMEKRFYAHFVDGDQMYVVYPSTIVTVSRGRTIDAAHCLRVGACFMVPPEQLPIEKMFEFGHAEH